MSPRMGISRRPQWHWLPASLVVLSLAANAQTMRTESAWDRQLPFLALKNVDTHEATAAEAWQAFSAAYGVRSVLFIEESEFKKKKPFTFQRKECLVRDWFDAFAAAYGLQWQTDPATGVNWLFPAGMSYEEILSVKINVGEDYYGLPLMSGVLSGFGALPALRDQDIYVNPGGWSFGRSMDYPMDISRGPHTLREIVNFACIANPILDFAVFHGQRYTNLMPANVLRGLKNRPNPGLLLFWETEIGDLDGKAPSKEEILKKLADNSARIRWAARLYLWILSPTLDTSRRGKDHKLDEESAVWHSLALLSIYVRDENVSHESLSRPLLRAANAKFFETTPPDLALLAALELARLTDDMTGVEIVLKRKLPDELLADLTSDVARIARASDRIWQVVNTTQGGLAGINAEWAHAITGGAADRKQTMEFSVVPAMKPPVMSAKSGFFIVVVCIAVIANAAAYLLHGKLSSPIGGRSLNDRSSPPPRP